MYTLSVIIPAYNESRTILQILSKVSTVTLPENVNREIIVIDDASTDDTAALIQKFQADHASLNLKLFSHQKNQGKGAALHTGIKAATGDFVVIQDADLEYDPAEFSILLHPVISNFADVVYGSRFIGGKPHRILFYWHSIGNRWLTNLSNMFTNLNLTDMETCYKMWRRDIIQSVSLKENRFGFEPEVTAKVSRIPKVRIYEVGISYYGRSFEDGKKIGWKDGFRAIWCILKYNIWAKR